MTTPPKGLFSVIHLSRYNESIQINWRCTALKVLHLKLKPFKLSATDIGAAKTDGM